MENLVIQPKWNPLFTDADREVAKNRLRESGFLNEANVSPEINQPKKIELNPDSIKHCPKCGGSMVLRTSREGKKFYGCSDYPRCNGTRSNNS